MIVGIYGTARNEQHNVEGWLDSTQGADVVVVNDSGSTDDTVERFRSLGVDVRQEPAADTAADRFNLALSLLPDVDLCIRLDLDERLQQGWREALERAWDKRTTTKPLLVPVWFDHGGNTYRHARAHSRHGFKWEFPVHELLVDEHGHPIFIDKSTPCVETITAEATIEHHQDVTKDRSTVLQSLIDAFDADPGNPRLMWYLAREHMDHGNWQQAIELFRQHTQTWASPEERADSWMFLGDCYRALMPIEDVPLTPYRNAATVCPSRRDGWAWLAECCYDQSNWADCLSAAEATIAITERSWHFNYPRAWGPRPYQLAALACYYLDRTDDAIRYGEQALALAPDDPQLAENMRWYRGEVAA